MAATRLRRTFRYPADEGDQDGDDDDDLPAHLDEEGIYLFTFLPSLTLLLLLLLLLVELFTHQFLPVY